MASVFKTKHNHPLFTHRNIVQYLFKQSKKCVIKGQKCKKKAVLMRGEQTHTHTLSARAILIMSHQCTMRIAISVYSRCQTDALPSAGKLSGLSARSAYLCLTGLDTGAIFLLDNTGSQAAKSHQANTQYSTLSSRYLLDLEDQHAQSNVIT